MSHNNAAVVGSSFVRRYYEFLAEKKGELYKFYGERACRTYVDDELDEANRTRVASGQQDIKQQIDTIQFDDLSLDLAAPYGSVNCQATVGGAILITVTGLIGFYGKANRRLVQTVVLQELSSGHFVVANDIFHVLKEDASAVKEVNVTEIVQPVVSEVAQQTEPIAEIPYEEPIPTEDVAAAVPTRQPHAIEAEEAPDLAALRLQGEENAAFQEEEVPGGSKSWVQIVGANAKNAAPPTAAAPKSSRAPRQKKAAAPANQQAPQQRPASNGRRQQGKGNAPQGKKGGSTSIFIKGEVLPAVEIDELRDLFGAFGTIKDITGNQDDMKLYIHYDNAAAVDSALERQTEHVRGQPISILPARSKPSGRGRGGRRGN